jgi:sulfide:quinone oxidoreductase
MAWDRYRRTRRGDNIDVEFITGMPTMFSVPKYSEALNKLREERAVGALFNHDLKSIDPGRRVASFKNADGVTVEKEYQLLHVSPPMGPLDFIKSSPLANAAGWVDVDQGTLQHTKFSNVFALGDASNLPTSKTTTAITSQAPVLARNLVSFLNTGTVGKAVYDGYTSCPVCASELPTQYCY